MSRPLICLVMIVRDEAKGIRETLRSVLQHVDRWLILDTGSSDGTQEIIWETLARVPGILVQEPFVDFGTSRTRALELAGEECVYTLMLSGNEVLRGGAELRRVAEEHEGKTGAEHEVELSGLPAALRKLAP